MAKYLFGGEVSDVAAVGDGGGVAVPPPHPQKTVLALQGGVHLSSIAAGRMHTLGRTSSIAAAAAAAAAGGYISSFWREGGPLI